MRNPANKQTNKQTDKQKILPTQRFDLSTLAVLAQCSYRQSYRASLIWLLLSDYYFSPNSANFIKIRPVVHEKQSSGSQIPISIRITPNFELGLPMIITSLLTKFHQNATSSLWEILLTNKQTKKQTKNFGHTQVRTLDLRSFSILLDYYYSPNSPNFMKIWPVVHEKQLSGCQIQISIRITANFELGLPMIITSLLTKFHQNQTSSLWEIQLTNKQTNKRFWPHRGLNSRLRVFSTML